MTCLMCCLLLLTPFMLLIDAASVNQDSLWSTPARTKKVVKRQTACLDGEYHTGSFCCKLCATGTHKTSDCTEEHGNPNCKPCEKGKEFFKDQECHRCTECDHGEGLETLQDCTAEENTKCQCLEGYFCNATSRCTHCEPCDKCENGKILEKCTRQKDTLCEENHRKRVVLAATVIVLIVAVAAAAAVLRCQRNLPTPYPENLKEKVPLQNGQSVDFPETYPDVDLTQHFASIAEILDIETTLLFVRRTNMTEPTIEQIRMDNNSHINEQKIQLVRKWYEEHGRAGAFGTLITTLINIRCRSSAERIFQQITTVSN